MRVREVVERFPEFDKYYAPSISAECTHRYKINKVATIYLQQRSGLLINPVGAEKCQDFNTTEQSSQSINAIAADLFSKPGNKFIQLFNQSHNNSM